MQHVKIGRLLSNLTFPLLMCRVMSIGFLLIFYSGKDEIYFCFYARGF